MCELAGVSRRGFYRFDPDAKPAERDMDLRDAIQRIALEMPSYGRPRITAELRRRGWVVNPKRVHRIMREDNLLCLRRRKFLVDHRFAARLPDLSQPGRQVATDQRQPALDCGHHVYSAGDRVRVSGCRSGCLLAPGDRLGSGPHAGGEADRGGAADGPVAPKRESGSGASFRPRRSVCSRRLHQPARSA